jgi:hypothetical protein
MRIWHKRVSIYISVRPVFRNAGVVLCCVVLSCVLRFRQCAVWQSRVSVYVLPTVRHVFMGNGAVAACLTARSCFHLKMLNCTRFWSVQRLLCRLNYVQYLFRSLIACWLVTTPRAGTQRLVDRQTDRQTGRQTDRSSDLSHSSDVHSREIGICFIVCCDAAWVGDWLQTFRRKAQEP